MKPGSNDKPDAFFTGLFTGALGHALRCLERQDTEGARLIMRQTLDEFLASDIGKDPQLRRTLGVR